MALRRKYLHIIHVVWDWFDQELLEWQDEPGFRLIQATPTAWKPDGDSWEVAGWTVIYESYLPS